jgi:tetratricopeptide (TPR) repeat protein
MGMISEAVEEFEKVVLVSPDNLFAHKKLAVLYRDIGKITEAIHAFQTVLVFAPKDNEAVEYLTELLSLQTVTALSVPVDQEAALPANASPKAFPTIETQAVDFSRDWEVVRPAPADMHDVRQGIGENIGADIGLSDGRTPYDEGDPIKKAEDPFETETLADLYIRQGEWSRGVAIYQRLLDKDPGNDSLRIKIRESDRPFQDPQKPQTTSVQRLESWLERIQVRAR